MTAEDLASLLCPRQLDEPFSSPKWTGGVDT
jgi:hypothetical protein